MFKKCTPLRREAHFQLKMWNLRCRKSARRCGAKHISKSKCTKHAIAGPLLESEMSKKCTPSWREARFQVKMHKALHVRTAFDGWDVVLRGRRKGLCTLSKVSKCEGFAAVSTTTTTTKRHTTLHYTTLHYTTLHYTTQHPSTLHYTPLHYTTRHYITLHYATLHFTPLHYITLHCIALHYTTLNCTALRLQQLQPHLQLRYFALHYTRLHYIAPPYVTLHQTHYTSTIYLQMHYTNVTTLQLQLHYATTTTTAAVHQTTCSSCGWGDHCNHCNHSNKDKSNHLSVNQWIPSAIRDSQQPTSYRFPILKLPPPPCAVLHWWHIDDILMTFSSGNKRFQVRL